MNAPATDRAVSRSPKNSAANGRTNSGLVAFSVAATPTGAYSSPAPGERHGHPGRHAGCHRLAQHERERALDRVQGETARRAPEALEEQAGEGPTQRSAKRRKLTHTSPQ